MKNDIIKTVTMLPLEIELQELFMLEHILEVELVRCEKLAVAKKKRGEAFYLSFLPHMNSLRNKVKAIREAL